MNLKDQALSLVLFYFMGQASLHFPVYFVVQTGHENARLPLENIENKQKTP